MSCCSPEEVDPCPDCTPPYEWEKGINWGETVREPFLSEIEQAKVLMEHFDDTPNFSQRLEILSQIFRNHSILNAEFALDNRSLRAENKMLKAEIQQLRELLNAAGSSDHHS